MLNNNYFFFFYINYTYLCKKFRETKFLEK